MPIKHHLNLFLRVISIVGISWDVCDAVCLKAKYQSLFVSVPQSGSGSSTGRSCCAEEEGLLVGCSLVAKRGTNEQGSDPLELNY